MTGPNAGGTVICRQCGTSNAAGDQFCGNCGTFLEWSAEPADGPAGASPGVATPDADSSLANLLEARPADQVAPTAGPAADVTASPPATLVRCPTCGTANEAGKTFCLKCGNKLAGATAATRLPLPPRSEPAAGGAAPLSAVPRPATRARQREAANEGGGISGWLVVAGAGIVVGAIAVVLVLVLGAGNVAPPAAASTAPSASALVSHAPSPSASKKPSAKPVKTAKPKPSK